MQQYNTRRSAEGNGILSLLLKCARLEAIDKLSVATSFLIVFGVIFVLAVSAIFFLSTGAVKTLSEYVGSEATANYIVGGVLVLLIIIFYCNRKRWVEGPVVRSISASVLAHSQTINEEGLDDEEY